MANNTGFFPQVKNTWNEYAPLRQKYSDQIPIPQQSYFKPIHSIDEFSTLAVRPISCPPWFLVNAALFFLKALLSLAATVLLVIPAVVLAIFAPNSNLSANTSTAFKQAVAHIVVSATMAVIAACATLASLVLNTLFLLTRCISTAVERLNDVTESAFGLTIAKF